MEHVKENKSRERMIDYLSGDDWTKAGEKINKKYNAMTDTEISNKYHLSMKRTWKMFHRCIVKEKYWQRHRFSESGICIRCGEHS